MRTSATAKVFIRASNSLRPAGSRELLELPNVHAEADDARRAPLAALLHRKALRRWSNTGHGLLHVEVHGRAREQRAGGNGMVNGAPAASQLRGNEEARLQSHRQLAAQAERQAEWQTGDKQSGKQSGKQTISPV